MRRTLIDVNVEITYGRHTTKNPDYLTTCAEWNLLRNSWDSRTRITAMWIIQQSTKALPGKQDTPIFTWSMLSLHISWIKEAFERIHNCEFKKREKTFEVSNFAISTTTYTPLKVRPLFYHMGQWQPNSIFKKTIINRSRTFRYLLSLRLNLVQCAALLKASSFCLQSLHSGYTIMETLKQYSKHVDWPSEFSFAQCESKSHGSELWMLF